MEIIKAAYNRHVVRHYDGQPLNKKHIKQLNKFIKKLNKKYKLHFQLMVNEPKAFGGLKAKISNITGCVNYLALIGKKSKDLNLLCGYVGEMIVLKAQQLGINSCWALLTYNKQNKLYKFNKDEKLVLVIALGYGTTQGKKHESKKFSDVCVNRGKLPQWFIRGVKMALIAPTGKNQQGFKFELLENNVVKLTNKSLCKDIDKGIVKYHFELGAEKNFKWLEKK